MIMIVVTVVNVVNTHKDIFPQLLRVCLCDKMNYLLASLYMSSFIYFIYWPTLNISMFAGRNSLYISSFTSFIGQLWILTCLPVATVFIWHRSLTSLCQIGKKYKIRIICISLYYKIYASAIPLCPMVEELELLEAVWFISSTVSEKNTSLMALWFQHPRNETVGIRVGVHFQPFLPVYLYVHLYIHTYVQFHWDFEIKIPTATYLFCSWHMLDSGWALHLLATFLYGSLKLFILSSILFSCVSFPA